MLTAKKWNDVVEHLALTIGLDEVVAPFGFEVETRNFSQRNNVLRLYVFYKSETMKEKEVLQKIKLELQENYPEIYENIGVLGSGRTGFVKNVSEPTYENYFLAIENIRTEKPLLQSYSEYVAGSAYLIGARLLPELSRIDENALARLRIRQLFRISCTLYPDLADESEHLLNTLSYRSIGVDPTIFLPNPDEVSEIGDISLKCADFLYECRSRKGYEIDVFAGGGRELIFLDEDMFFDAVNKVSSKYMDFYE